MLPTFFYIEEENNLIRPTKIQCWFKKSEILEIIKSCNDTLDYYQNLNYDDDKIDKLNDEWFEKEYMLFHNNYNKKPKTFVYIMIDNNTNYYKIGRSKNPTTRERTLQSEKPTIELIYSFECEYGVEKELHDIYKDKRVRGEWFNLDQNDINNIKNNYK